VLSAPYPGTLFRHQSANSSNWLHLKILTRRIFPRCLWAMFENDVITAIFRSVYLLRSRLILFVEFVQYFSVPMPITSIICSLSPLMRKSG